jgi:TP901-1 family phage major tail protein
MAIAGMSVLLMVETATGTFKAVGEQKGMSLESSRNLIEVSSKNNDHATFVYGRKSDTVSLEALYVPSDEGFAALKDAMENKQPIVIRRSEDGEAIEEAEALVGSFSIEFPDEDAAVCSVELTLNESFHAITTV